MRNPRVNIEVPDVKQNVEAEVIRLVTFDRISDIEDAMTFIEEYVKDIKTDNSIYRDFYAREKLDKIQRIAQVVRLAVATRRGEYRNANWLRRLWMRLTDTRFWSTPERRTD